MRAPLLLSLHSDPASAGADARAALPGLVLIAVYVGVLAWLHVRRRRTRHAADQARNALPERVEPRPRHPAPAPSGMPAAPKRAPPASAPSRGSRRLGESTLQPLADRFECSRRVAVAEARVGEVLQRLPCERWLTERYVVVAGQRVPFVVLGETGVFLLWGLDQTPLWEDLPFVNRAAGAVQALLPGYTGEVRVGLCRAFDPVVPRWWYATNSASGAWLLGVNWLERWLEHFGDTDGLADGDIAWTACQAQARWAARRRGSLPTTPNLG